MKRAKARNGIVEYEVTNENLQQVMSDGIENLLIHINHHTKVLTV
jgi:hypothetical protein